MGHVGYVPCDTSATVPVTRQEGRPWPVRRRCSSPRRGAASTPSVATPSRGATTVTRSAQAGTTWGSRRGNSAPVTTC